LPAIASDGIGLVASRVSGFKTPEKIWRCHSEDDLLAAIDELDKIRHDFALRNRRRRHQAGTIWRCASKWAYTSESAALGHRLQIRAGTGANPA
jgi:hypothetical protein